MATKKEKNKIIKLPIMAQHYVKSLISHNKYDNIVEKIIEERMKNPVAKEVRTPKFKSQVVKSKKIYDRKKPHEDWYRVIT